MTFESKHLAGYMYENSRASGTFFQRMAWLLGDPLHRDVDPQSPVDIEQLQ